MRRAALLLIALTLGCASRAQELSDRGDELLFALDYERAARQFELVLHECGESRAPGDLALRIRTHLRLAAVRQNYLDDPQGALRGYRAALELGAQRERAIEARLGLVSLFRDRIGDAAAAADELSALLTAHPDHPRAQALNLELARLSFRAGRWADAERVATGARTRLEGADAVEATMLTATALEMQGRTDRALETYRTLENVKLTPTLQARVRFEIGRTLERLGDLDSALKYYRSAASGSVSPTLVAARVDRVERRIEAARKPAKGRASFHRARASAHDRPRTDPRTVPARTTPAAVPEKTREVPQHREASPARTEHPTADPPTAEPGVSKTSTGSHPTPP